MSLQWTAAESHTSASVLSHKSIKQTGKMQWEKQLFPGDGGCARPAELHHPDLPTGDEHLPPFTISAGNEIAACVALAFLTHRLQSTLQWARSRSEIHSHHHGLSPACKQVAANCSAYRGLISARHCFILHTALPLEIFKLWKRLRLSSCWWWGSACSWYIGKKWQIATEKDACANL